jgi:hypothetical protein
MTFMYLGSDLSYLVHPGYQVEIEVIHVIFTPLVALCAQF